MTQKKRKAELERLIKAIMDYRMMINLPQIFKEQCIALAEYLIYGIGVIVPPCQVGDTVYAMWYRSISKEYFITPIVVESMVFGKDDWYITTSNDGCFFW